MTIGQESTREKIREVLDVGNALKYGVKQEIALSSAIEIPLKAPDQPLKVIHGLSISAEDDVFSAK